MRQSPYCWRQSCPNQNNRGHPLKCATRALNALLFIGREGHENEACFPMSNAPWFWNFAFSTLAEPLFQRRAFHGLDASAQLSCSSPAQSVALILGAWPPVGPGVRDGYRWLTFKARAFALCTEHLKGAFPGFENCANLPD